MTEKKDVYELLNYLQTNINAPKNQRNNFGNYNYRNVEDIMESIKPLIKSTIGAYVFVSDEIVQLGDRFYIKATATVGVGDKTISNTAYARESLEKKGMDSSQITGATSSYARKYALGGLLLIDDNKDADSDEKSQKTTEQKLEKAFESPTKGIDRETQEQMHKTALNHINACDDEANIDKYVKAHHSAWKKTLAEDLYIDIKQAVEQARTDLRRNNAQNS